MLQTFRKKAKKIAYSLAAGVLLFSQFAVVPTVGATDSNHINYWCSEYDGGVKFEVGSGNGKLEANDTDEIDDIEATLSGNKEEVDVKSNDPGKTITLVVVKAGSVQSNNGPENLIYDTAPFDNLTGPLNKEISHVIACYDEDDTTIEVIKALVPSNDSGRFNLGIDVKDTNEGDTTATNKGNNGTTGKVEVSDRKDITVSEAAYAGTDLDDYTTTIACVYEDGSLVPLSNIDTTGGGRDAEIDSRDIDKGDDIVCTFTNTRKTGDLKVIKDIVNDNGGTKTYANFTFKINDGDTPRSFDETTSPDGEKVVTLPVGTDFAVTEVEANSNGYATTYSGDCSGIIEADQTQVCTITNDDNAALLTVSKHVDNDNNGGTPLNPSDFPLSIQQENGPVIPVLSGIQQAVGAGTYVVSEVQQPGYVLKNGVGGACAIVNGQILITLLLGQTAECDIYNEALPATIKVTKIVENNNGGDAEAEDFTLKVDDTVVESGVTNTFDGNVEYTVSETGGPQGYKKVSEECWDVTDVKTAVGTTFTAQLGHDYECTIVNDDKAPKLKVVKAAFPWWTDQEFDFTSEELGDFSLESGDHEFFGNLQAGEYTVTEEATEGWYLKNIYCFGTDEQVDLAARSVTMNLEIGDFVICTFFNGEFSTVDGFKFEDVNGDGHYDDENEPKLSGWTITIEKLCKEQEGESEANLFEGGHECETFEDSTVTDDEGNYSFDELKPGLYKVCEVQQDGWVQTKPDTEDGCKKVWLWFGSDKFVKFGNFELGKVTGVKFNDVNGNGKRDNGEATLKDWTITLTNICTEPDVREDSLVTQDIGCKEETKTTKTDANGAYVFSGLEAGDYIVCEIQQANWTQTFPTDNNGCHEVTVEGNESGGVITADFGNKAKPQVLGEVTPKELVKTGASAAASTFAGLMILSILGALHLLARRKSYSN